MLFCWALYDEGQLLEARTEFAKLTKDPDNPVYLAFQINLAMTLGDWNELVPIIDNEFKKKDKRSAQNLLSAAKLALYLNLPNAKDLLFSAAEKGKDSAGVLTSAYFLAINAGLDNDKNVVEWLHKAAALSGDKGPIQKKTLKE